MNQDGHNYQLKLSVEVLFRIITSALLAICLSLAGWSLDNTVSLRERVVVLENTSLDKDTIPLWLKQQFTEMQSQLDVVQTDIKGINKDINSIRVSIAERKGK